MKDPHPIRGARFLFQLAGLAPRPKNDGPSGAGADFETFVARHPNLFAPRRGEGA